MKIIFKFLRNNNAKGFTLLEIVISIILSSFVGVILMQITGTAMQKSVVPLLNTQENYKLNTVIESVTIDYKALIITDPTPLATLQTRILNGNDIANTPYYGEYTPVTKYITFDGGGNEVLDASGNPTILKVTITKNNHSFTTLFTN